ncbi:hypothetical protein [Candidatus Mycobacterium methanotrophicum]|uniref:Uncharacterized protein n=1 Tax=Candidatus Mycobacterium methanotrophicum TaxID=2943498 RepID=A0ABY4QNW7_9MYCO|nr:hypothetical protein [Candidatus Mycobacterium methanotrophicum]UQX11320.1 hypothetical protein M5I08_01915 [Candidatus Mycobacterium methanotrophicum]
MADITYPTIDGWVMPNPEPGLEPYAGLDIRDSWSAVQQQAWRVERMI